MRTTVTLDPDVEAVVRAEMRATGKGFKAALNDLVRRSTHDPDDDFRMPEPVSGGELLVDITHVNALLAELDAEAYVAKFGRSQ
jgi:hypothetical protein